MQKQNTSTNMSMIMSQESNLVKEMNEISLGDATQKSNEGDMKKENVTDQKVEKKKSAFEKGKKKDICSKFSLLEI